MHPRSLIRAFAIRLLLRGNFKFLGIVYVAEQAALNLNLSETPKTGFLTSRHNLNAQKNRLIESVRLSTLITCFD